MTQQEYKFADGTKTPTFKQLGRLGQVIAKRTLGKEFDSITQQEVSNLINSSLKELGKTESSFNLKHPENPATFNQFIKFGGLRAEVQKLTTMQSVSNAIQSSENEDTN